MVSLALVCSFSRMRNLLGLGNIRRGDIPARIVDGVAKILRTCHFLKVSDDGMVLSLFVTLALTYTLISCLTLVVPCFSPKGKGSVEQQNSQSRKRCLNKSTEEPLRRRLLSTAQRWRMCPLSSPTMPRSTVLGYLTTWQISVFFLALLWWNSLLNKTL